MCGIFGYVGNQSVKPILIEGLRTLEYRGYDSAGIFVPSNGVTKSVGAIANLATKVKEDGVGTSGIAHTRWATHGPPTEQNAHPHSDMSGDIYIVHNGIIENYRSLRESLIAQGITFNTDTDTEVLAKLIGTHYSGNLLEAVREALTMVRGTYGLAVMSEHTPNEIVVARLGSPIVLGISPDGNFVSSDPSALIKHTKDVIYLEDGEMAVIGPDRFEVMSRNGRTLEKETEELSLDASEVQKQGYEHFMLKEIFEGPEVIENTTRGRLILDEGRIKLGGLESHLSELKELEHLTIVGCGSAYYAGYVGKYLIEEYANLPVDIELASEYRYKTNFKHGQSALLAVTQSGETADTLAAVRQGKKLGLLTLGMVNVVGSTIARETDAGVYNHAGPEVAVASTKAFLSQLTAFAMVTIMIARERGMSPEKAEELVRALSKLPDTIRKVLDQAPKIKDLAEKYAHYENAMYIGRKFHRPIASEGALKLKEVAYIHAEAYAGGELKHGPIALLGPEFPVIALALQDDVYEKMISNIEEVKARGAQVLAIGNENDHELANLADDMISIPKVHPVLQPILSTVPLHLFAYYAGIARGHNVDRPRNLAKSVTVE